MSTRTGIWSNGAAMSSRSSAVPSGLPRYGRPDRSWRCFLNDRARQLGARGFAAGNMADHREQRSRSAFGDAEDRLAGHHSGAIRSASRHSGSPGFSDTVNLPMKDILDKLEARRTRAREGGGKARIEAQHKRGKLTA